MTALVGPTSGEAPAYVRSESAARNTAIAVSTIERVRGQGGAGPRQEFHGHRER